MSSIPGAVATPPGENFAGHSGGVTVVVPPAGLFQPLDSDLTAIAALSTTAYGRALLALADAAAGRTALGLGTAATHATGDYDAAGAAAAAQAASQPVDSDLTAIAALTTTSFGRALLALANPADATKFLNGTGAFTVPAGNIGLFNVKSYGAKGDGVHDDRAAIQAAIDAAGAAGGGTVWLPAGTFQLVSTVISLYGDTHLIIRDSHITLAGPGTLHSSVDVAMIAVGVGIDAGTYVSAYLDATVYDLTPVAKGAMSLTLATAGEAANFAPGDYIYIRTGQVIDAYNIADAETNQVLSVNAGTGVIDLSWPTAKAYAQEYYISGTSGLTSTSVTANPAPFGVSNVTALALTDITFRDFNIVYAGPMNLVRVINAEQIVGMRFLDLTGSFATGLQAVNNTRFVEVRGCRLDHPGTGVQTYTLTTASGTCDVVWADNIISGERVVQLHVHEGSARVNVHNNVIVTAGSAGDEVQIDVRARAYDISILGNTLAGTMPAQILVDDTCSGGGIIAHNIVLGSGAVSIYVASPGWFVGSNQTPNAQVVLFSRYAGSETETRSLTAWVSTAHTSPTLGILPANSLILGVTMFVYEAFNSSGTDLISVGNDRDAFRHDQFAATTDVSATGTKVAVAGWYAYGEGSVAADTVQAFYVAGGTAPSTGKVLVTLTYTTVPAAF